MTPVQTNPNPPPPDLLEERIGKSRQAWKNLGRSLLSITPARLVRIVLVVSALAGLVWLVLASWPALAPFIAGGVLAYVVLPMVNALDRVLPRLLAAFISVLFVLACIGGILWVIVPPLIRQTVTLIQQIPPDTTIQSLSNSLVTNVQTLPPAARDLVAKAIISASGNLRDHLNNLAPTLVSPNAVARLLNAVGFVLGLVVLPTWILTALKGLPEGKLALNRWLPTSAQADFWAFLRIIDRSFGIFLRGQVLISFAVGLMTYLGLESLIYLGAPQGRYPVTLAVFAGLLQLIPDVGPLVNLVVVALLAYRIDPQLAIYVIVLYLGIQYLVNRLVSDRIQARIININPALLVLFIVALGQLGFIWLFLAAPLVGLSHDLLRYVYSRLSDPPRPAGLLPDEKLPQSASAKLMEARQQQTPMVYRRMQARQNHQS